MKLEQLLNEQYENHILPFLWVHGEGEAMYRKMVGVIDDSNIRAFCVEARPHKDFCGPGWWKDMGIILDEAEKRGMKVWILDDRHFPTGAANDKVVDRPIELRRQGMFQKTFPVEGSIELDVEKECHPSIRGRGAFQTGLYIFSNLYAKNYSKKNRFHDDHMLSAVALRKDRAAEPVDLTDYVRDGKLSWTAPEGEWEVRLCNLSRNMGAHRSYINMMDKESVRILLDEVYEPHYAHFKDKFGTVIAGFFSDEPELGNNQMYRMENPMGCNQELPWSRELEAALKERLGEDFHRYIALLWENGCDAALTAKVRYIYMDCVSALVRNCFSKQVGEWCRSHGVDYIGHMIEDNNEHCRTGSGLGHYFRGLQYQSMAGIDLISQQIMPGKEDENQKHPLGFLVDREYYHYALGKLGTSLGALTPHMQGRTMCELFGAYGWMEGVRLERYLIDHLMVRGVNYFVPHAFNCKAFPDMDCPPHFYAQGNNPQYRHFGQLMLYANRVCNLTSGGMADTPVAILYHGEAEWTGKCMLMQKPARVCADHQVDFLFVPSDAFAEREFYKTSIGKTLSVNGHEFRVLVVPYAQFITPETAGAIAEWQKKGGSVLFVDALPDGLTDGTALPKELKRTPVVPLEKLYRKLLPYRTVTLAPANDRVRAMHYRGTEDLVYLFNEGDKTFLGTVDLPLKGPVCVYNAWDNRLESVEMDRGKVRVELAPSQSLLLVPQNGRAVEEPIRLTGTKTKLTRFERSVCRSIDYPDFGEVEQIRKLESYHKTKRRFSGYIRYETTFLAKEKTVLEITEAFEGVEVFVNGQSAGIQVTAPFRYDLTPLCRPGENKLTIEVATTLARERGTGIGADPTGITGTVALYQNGSIRSVELEQTEKEIR